MKTTARFLLLISCFLLVLTAVPDIYAQTAGDLTQPNQNWQCLDAKKTAVHTAEISSRTANQFPPAGTDVYIVECVATTAGAKCTTGECSTDIELVGNCNDLNFLQSQYRYKLVNFSGTQPTKSDFEGKVGPFIWKSDVYPRTGHTFFGVGVTAPITLGQGQWPTLQLGTFYFPNSSESCQANSVRWDPYGRIFDSVSLEPIPNASVTLFSKINNSLTQTILPGLTNPQYTQFDGVFNFVVPDGTYQLKPQIQSHTFPNKPDKLNPNYFRAYYDIYRGEDIVQQGFIQHRDIPMDPNSAPLILPAKILDYSTVLDKLNSRFLISGSVSHPLSRVRVYSGTQFIKQVTADKFGNFSISLDNATLNQSLPLRLEVIKADLNSPQANLINPLFKFVSQVFAQESSVTFEPIMNNIAGYAFDSEGNTVPNATVNILLESSDKPFYSLKADDLGFFTVPSQFLPPLPFYIQVKSPAGKISNLKGTEFASLNARYTEAASVNYGTYNPQVPGTLTTSTEENITRTVIGPDGKVITVESGNGEIVKENEEGQIVTAQEEAQSNAQAYQPEEEGKAAPAKKNSSLIVVLIITVLSILIALFLYFKIKKHTS